MNEITLNPPLPNGIELPADRVLGFLGRYPLPDQIGAGWLTLDPNYAIELIELLYDASGETPALLELFASQILARLPAQGSAQDVGSGRGRLLELFRDFQRVQLIERDPLSLAGLRAADQSLALGADILHADYRALTQQREQFDLVCFTHSIYYFDQDWGELARAAFASVKPGGSLVFTLNGDEADPADLPDHLAALGYAGLAPLDIGGFVDACTQIDNAEFRVYRLPLRIPYQHHPDFLVHMARIFLEDHGVPIPTWQVRDYLSAKNLRLGFVDKIVVLDKKAR
ncbi:class I SAM-dependent methyltransferase [Halochromatium sp.]